MLLVYVSDEKWDGDWGRGTLKRKARKKKYRIVATNDS